VRNKSISIYPALHVLMLSAVGYSSVHTFLMRISATFFILAYISISYIERVLQNGGERVLMAVLCQLIELMGSIDHFELFPV
jgi:hypothetical protein